MVEFTAMIGEFTLNGKDVRVSFADGKITFWDVATDITCTLRFLFRERACISRTFSFFRN